MTSLWWVEDTPDAKRHWPPPGSAGRWMGVQSGIGNLSGVVGPVITGMIVDAAGYPPAFILTAIIIGIGAAAYVSGVPRLKPILAQG